jgi:hypothetical protein
MATREVLVVATDGFATHALAGTLRRDGWTVRRAPAGHEADAFRGRPAAIVLPAPPAALPAAVGRLLGLTDGVIVGVSAYRGEAGASASTARTDEGLLVLPDVLAGVRQASALLARLAEAGIG